MIRMQNNSEMDFQTKYITPEIKLSIYPGNRFKSEALFEHHLLVWLIDGYAEIIQTDVARVFEAGDVFLIPRNQLSTVICYSKDGIPHKSVAMHLTPSRLMEYYSTVSVHVGSYPSDTIRSYKGHLLLESFFASLVPYFDIEELFPSNIAVMKINEAISILRVVDPAVDSLLANFAEPGKIDLAVFMEKHFRFNLPLEKFGYLTGRSIATFNRDFRKVFHITPQRWLTKKRLELAYFQLKEQHQKPVDVYLEVGFENLSHFSYAFKKQFGYSPSKLVVKNI
jgi:AraC-like DNA-binding protein